MASVPPALWCVRTPRKVWAVGVASGGGETGDAFAGRKWPENGRFVRAKVSVVSTVCGKELAEVPAVSSRGSDPPALVSSVSGKVVGRCCEVAAVPVGSVGAYPPENSHVIRLDEVSIKPRNVAIPTI